MKRLKILFILIAVLMLFLMLVSCKNYDVVNHHHRAGVMPTGVNKKYVKFEKK